MKLQITRDYHGADCTMGVLRVDNLEFQTIERPWVPRPNAPCGTKGVSCIPPGTYRLHRHNSEAHPNTWALVNPLLWVYHFEEDVAPGQLGAARTLVLIHAANFASELRGCVAPGLSRFREANGRRMVLNSRKAMGALQAAVPWINGHELEIV